MYKRAPTAEQLASMGLKIEDYADDEEEAFEIWPENWPVYELWNIVGDQWRMGSMGPVALDLMPVFHELDRAGLDKEAYDHLLCGVKTMASEALSEIQSQAPK